jgi:hypothetical protein
MVKFWSWILLDTSGYKGKPFDAHAKQSAHITSQHFQRWIALFRETVLENFEGETCKVLIALPFRSLGRNVLSFWSYPSTYEYLHLLATSFSISSLSFIH